MVKNVIQIIKKRGCGKTTELIKLSAETGAYIVSSNPHRVSAYAKEMGYEIPFPLSYREFIEKRYKFGIELLIDDADMLFERNFGENVIGYSLTVVDESQVHFNLPIYECVFKVGDEVVWIDLKTNEENYKVGTVKDCLRSQKNGCVYQVDFENSMKRGELISESELIPHVVWFNKILNKL